MTKSTPPAFFETFAELRNDLRTVEATPLVTSLLLLHAVHRLPTRYQALGVELPEQAAAELLGLDLPLARVGDLVHEVLGERLQGAPRGLNMPDLDPAVVARTSRSVGVYVSQLVAGHEEREALAAVGQAATLLLDYGVRQFPATSGVVQTPETLAQLTVSLLDAQPGMTVLDSSVGFARTLVEVARDQVAQGHDPNALRYVGQELQQATALLGAMHLLLNGVTNFVIHVGDTLTQPATEPESFDRVIADPPIGMAVPHLVNALSGDRRFAFGRKSLPKTADWLFLQHGLTSLKPGGRAVFVTAHGPMFRGGSEGSIRQDLLAAGWLNTVVSLPSALYPNTGLPLVLTVFDRPRAGERGQDDVLMIDATSVGVREGRTQVLTRETREALVDRFTQRQGDAATAVLVSHDRIYANKDAWQPNQYLEREAEAGRSVADIRAELARREKNLRDAETELGRAFDALLT